MGDDAEIDALFQLPLAEFIAARNGLAARLRAAGAAEAAARVKAFTKPSAAAWAVNQVYWKERAVFEALIEAAKSLRAVQRGGGTPDTIREAMRRRRDSLAVAARRAEGALAASGHGAPTATVLRITSTFEALASAEAPGPNPGRLTADLDPPGFEALAGLTLADPPPAPSASPAPPVVPTPRVSPALDAEAEATGARAALGLAEEELRRCSAAEAEAIARREAALRRAEAASQARESVRREAERAEFAARAARDDAEAAQRQADDATGARVRAEGALEMARRTVADSGRP